MSVLETSESEALARSRKLSDLLEELVRAAETGDRGRFDEVFDACVGRVYAVACSVTQDRRGAEQVTADVLLRAVQRGSRAVGL